MWLKDRDRITAAQMDRDCSCQSKKWKDGNYMPNVSTLIRLAEYFDVSTDYLLGLDNSASDEETALIAKYRLLDASQKNAVNVLINGFIAESPVKKRIGNRLIVEFKRGE